MSPQYVKFALALSLLFNVSVIGAIGFQAYRHNGWPVGSGGHSHTHLVDELLALSPEQSRLWREQEVEFKHNLEKAWIETSVHREHLIREIFSPIPDHAAIEAARTAISQLQEAQQKQVIAQLMRERQMLDDNQRQLLAKFLIREPGESMEGVLRLHRD